MSPIILETENRSRNNSSTSLVNESPRAEGRAKQPLFLCNGDISVEDFENCTTFTRMAAKEIPEPKKESMAPNKRVSEKIEKQNDPSGLLKASRKVQSFACTRKSSHGA